MSISKRAKIMTGAVALAGVVALTGGAFTAGGITNSAGGSQFIGGEVSQTVTGEATLSDVGYTFTDVSNTDVTSVKLTFSTFTAGSVVNVEMNGSGTDVLCVADAGTTTVDDFDCDISATGAVSSLEVKVTEAA
jgi:hypothetical protein